MTTLKRNYKPIIKILTNFLTQIGISMPTNIIKQKTLKQYTNGDLIDFAIDGLNIRVQVKFEKHDEFNYIKSKKIESFIVHFRRDFFEKFGYGNLKYAKYVTSVSLNLNWIDIDLTVKYIVTYSLDAIYNSSYSGRHIANVFFNRNNELKFINGYFKDEDLVGKEAKREYVEFKGDDLNEVLPLYLFSKNNPEEFENIFGLIDLNNYKSIPDFEDKMALIDMIYL
jgi:hypothetical protein